MSSTFVPVARDEVYGSCLVCHTNNRSGTDVWAAHPDKSGHRDFVHQKCIKIWKRLLNQENCPGECKRKADISSLPSANYLEDVGYFLKNLPGNAQESSETILARYTRNHKIATLGIQAAGVLLPSAVLGYAVSHVAGSALGWTAAAMAATSLVVGFKTTPEDKQAEIIQYTEMAAYKIGADYMPNACIWMGNWLLQKSVEPLL